MRRYRNTKLAALFFSIAVIFFWWIPVIYTLNATIPPLEAMNRSEGVLAFTRSFKKSGHRMLLLQEDDGTKHKFSCSVTLLNNGTCGGYEHTGKRAVVWWHPLDVYPLWTIEHAAQIEVDGKLMVFYERTLWELASAKKDDPWFAIGSTIFFLILLIVIYKIERRRHEQQSSA